MLKGGAPSSALPAAGGDGPAFPKEIPAADFCCYLCIMSQWLQGEI